MDGGFKRYTNNAGYVSRDAPETITAFSHWTYVYTGACVRAHARVCVCACEVCVCARVCVRV